MCLGFLTAPIKFFFSKNFTTKDMVLNDPITFQNRFLALPKSPRPTKVIHNDHTHMATAKGHYEVYCCQSSIGYAYRITALAETIVYQPSANKSQLRIPILIDEGLVIIYRLGGPGRFTEGAQALFLRSSGMVQ